MFHLTLYLFSFIFSLSNFPFYFLSLSFSLKISEPNIALMILFVQKNSIINKNSSFFMIVGLQLIIIFMKFIYLVQGRPCGAGP